MSNRELLMLVKQLCAAVKAGYNTAQALDIAYGQARGRLRYILTRVISDVKHGAYLHESFGKYEKYFSPLFLNLIKTGELSGSLKENLSQLAMIIEKEHEFRHKIRSAMMYPMFVLIAVTGLGLAVGLFVLPNLLPLFSSLDTDLPITTKILLWFAKAFDAYGTQIFLSFLFLIVFIIWFFRREFSRPFTHWLILKMPITGRLTRQLSMARFGRSLASLSRSGMPIDESLKVTASVLTNHYYRKAVSEIIPLIKRGQTIANSLRRQSRFFDDIFIKLLALGESTAGLEEACDNVADYFEGEVDNSMKNLAVSLEPLLIIFVGIFVAFVAFSILGPIYKITGSIR